MVKKKNCSTIKILNIQSNFVFSLGEGEENAPAHVARIYRFQKVQYEILCEALMELKTSLDGSGKKKRIKIGITSWIMKENCQNGTWHFVFFVTIGYIVVKKANFILQKIFMFIDIK